MPPTPAPEIVGEERFFDLSLDLLAVVGFDGWFRRVNPAWVRELGWTEEELKARPWPEFIHPDDRARTLAEAERLSQPGTVTRDFELRALHRDGSCRWLLISARGFLPEAAIYAVAKDITDRKRAEEALVESEQRFRAVTESVKDAIVSADAEGRVVLWNPAAERTFGYPADEALGRPTEEFVAEADRARWRDGFARLRAGDPRLFGHTIELAGLRKDGTEMTLEVSVGEWRSEDRPFYTGTIRDVTDARRTAEYLRAQQAVDQILLESPPTIPAMSRTLAALGEAMGWAAGGYWELDADADLLRCRAFWAADPERAREFEAETLERTRARGQGLPGRVLATGEPAWVTDVSTDDNFPRAEVAARAGLHGALALPVVSGGGQVVAVLDFFTAELRAPDEDLLAMMRAISSHAGQFLRRKLAEERLEATAAELRRRAEELERSNADLEQFAYVASHDLTEPLRMISGFVQLLSERYKGRLDADADEFIGYTVDGVERMQALITDLLAYSRVGRAVEDEPVDLADVMRDALAALRAAVAERDAEVEVGDLPVVHGDRRELTQLFQNLLSNALKFVAEGRPRVAVSARREGDEWAVVVRDNGIGIEPRHAERIFKMFQRLHARDEYEGTGIGLAICKKIVDRHGGEIDVAPAEGGGTAFTVTLPAAREEAA